MFSFHTLCGVLVARTLECFAILASNGPHFVRTLHYDLSLVALPNMAYSFIELCKPLCHDKPVIHEREVKYTSNTTVAKSVGLKERGITL